MNRARVTQTASNQFLLKVVTVVCLLLGLTTAGFAPLKAEPGSNVDLLLTILHTNDLHAHDEPFLERGRIVGGMARIAYLISSIKKTAPHAIVIDAGDIFQGTPYFKRYHGEVEVSLLNQAGYDIYTIGNHEFDEGAENLARQLKLAKFKIISTNIDASDMPELAQIISPSTVKTFAGRQVAFIGAVTPELDKVSLNTGSVKIKRCKEAPADWLCPIRQEVIRLKEQGIDRIVLVTHCGLDLDKQLAREIPQIDVIVGGHSHTFLRKPVVVRHADGGSTFIVQAGSYGRGLGKLTAAFDAKGRIVPDETKYALLPITDRIPQSEPIAAYLKEKGKPLQELKNKLVGVALGDFDNQFRRYPGDSPLGNLVCNALIEAGTTYGAQIALQNRGGIRGRIERGFISQEKIEEVLPFDNHVVFATIPGKTLLRVLERSVAGGLGGQFLDVSGLKIVYDRMRPPGQRLQSAKCKDHQGSWQEIKTDVAYKIAVNDFTFGGGEGYDFSAASNVQNTGQRIAEVLARYLIKHKKVRPSLESRIVSLRVAAHAAK